MDSLFIMQRFWGDDTESDTENYSKSSISNDSYILSNKKLKLDTPDIEINDQNDKSYNTEQLLDSSNCNNLSTRTYNENQELEIPLVSVNETDSEIEILQNTEYISFENNCMTLSEETVSLAESKLSKKKKKNILNLQAQENEEFVTLKNNVPQKENADENCSEQTVCVAENRISKKRKKHKCNNIDMVENEKNIYVENNTLQEQNVDKAFCTIGQLHHPEDVKILHALPYWLRNPTYISVNLLEGDIPISELKYLDSNSIKNLKDVGINFLFPVQLAVIPWLMQSKEQSLLIRPSDICVSAPTGSGKTLAFVLPIVQSLKDRVVCAIRALIVLPVNELAIQVYKVFETFIRGTDLKAVLITGQKSFVAEQNALIKSDGKKYQNLVDIVITTPGRLLDHIYRTKGFCLKRLRYLVIDEADRMMEEIQQGWLKDVEDAMFHDFNTSNCVCSSFKRMTLESSSAFNFGFISQPVQKLLFSATLTHDPEQLYSLSLYKPKLFTTSSANSEQEYIGTCTIPSELHILQVICEEGLKPMVICHLFKHYNFRRVLCFTESIERAHRLHLVLEEMGILQVREISSFNRAVQRKIVLEQFSSGKIDILVCSDLVARGIDIENVDCVISYDVPQFIKIYIHRIGRTARAGKIGTAITLLSEGEMPHFRKMLTSLKMKTPGTVNINPEDLKPFMSLYKTALLVADTKLKKEKLQGRSIKKR